MIDALISGRLYGKPNCRTSKNGNPFATAKVRTPTRDGEAYFINVIAFSRTAIDALLALDDGDSIALAGELSVKVYVPASGCDPRPSLDLLAHAVLTEYHIQRKRKAVTAKATEAERRSDSQQNGGDEFNDDIPF